MIPWISIRIENDLHIPRYSVCTAGRVNRDAAGESQVAENPLIHLLVKIAICGHTFIL